MANVLVLEDDDSVNRGVSFSLEKAGHKVFSAGLIAEAKKIVENEEINLVVCDINLPDGDGREFIRMLREKTGVYVICLTALDQETDQVMGYEAGADDYVTKPFSLSVLMLKIEAVLRRNATNGGRDDVVSGNIRICMQEMKAYVHGQAISLTKNEWKLLTLFVAHPKHVLSKNQILESIFDIDGEFVDENTVAVNIRRLREKIESNPAKPEYIKNLRGLGYVWNKDVSR